MSPRDKALLKKFIEKGLALEKLWPGGEGAKFCLAELRALIEKLATADSHDLKRLHIHKKDLHDDMTSRHLAAVLVPFERLGGRTLRDDEIEITENDQVGRVRDTAPLVVIADNIRSAFNVGAIFRTAEAMGLERVVLTGYTPSPDEAKTKNTSMGAEAHIPWQRIDRAEQAVAELKSQGYSIICLETAKEAELLGDFVWPKKSALILGNERFGLDQAVIALSDHVVRIPQFGIKNSLNVGIAFGIAAADYRKPKAYRAIGTFRASAKHPYEARRQGVVDDSQETGVVELARGQGFEQALEDLEGFERVWLVYEFHHNANWKPKVLPPRGPAGKKRGVFATRSPYRPNPIGLSSVELIKVEGRKLFVRGFDLLDATPILDIKPYLPYADAFSNAKAGWTDDLQQAAYKVAMAPRAKTAVDWLKARGVNQLEGFLFSNLEFDPLDDERKRVVHSETGLHVLKYRTWRAEFSLNEADRTVRVETILSGYSAEDLSMPEDKYQDKQLHREFNAEVAQ